MRLISGPLVVTRYNLYPAQTVQGDWPPGVSSGEAIDALENLADVVLPPKMKCEWTEITYLQLIAENTGMVIFGLAVLLVFLVLAAQYESWSLPLAIIMVVPMCLLSAIIGVFLTHSDINIFTQIGFVVLVGLASKNAVLIVEFAKHKREHGMSRREATLEACRLRLRPILMTSFAFILGVVPLVWSTGAGFEMRQALGVAVFSGMLGVTFFGILLTPVFFSVIDWVDSTPALHSHLAHRINRVMLGVFAFGYVRQLGRWSRRTVELRLAAKPTSPAKAEITEPHPANAHTHGERTNEATIGHLPAPVHRHLHSAGHAAGSNGDEPASKALNGDSTNGAAAHDHPTNGVATNGTTKGGNATHDDFYETSGHHEPTPDPTLPD